MAGAARSQRLVDGNESGLRGCGARRSDHCASRTWTNRAGKGLTVAIGDMWHRTLVYFGMADSQEDDFHDDEFEDAGGYRSSTGSAGRHPAEDDLERNYRERPNVRRLGPRRRDDFDDIYAADPGSSRSAHRPTVMRAVDSRPSPARSEVHLMLPKNFNDAQQIADKFK